MPINKDSSKGFAFGLAAAVLVPVAATALLTVGRPATRAAIRAGLIIYERGRETLAEIGEVAEDLVAEAKAELEEAYSENASEFDVEHENDNNASAEAKPDDTTSESEEKVDKA